MDPKFLAHYNRILSQPTVSLTERNHDLIVTLRDGTTVTLSYPNRTLLTIDKIVILRVCPTCKAH